MVKDFKNMVEKSLNLSEAWYVKGAEFHAEEPAKHISIDVKKSGRELLARNAAEQRKDTATNRASVFGGMEIVCFIQR